MLIYEMESSFLGSRAFPLTCLDEAAILIDRVPSLDKSNKDPRIGLTDSPSSLPAPSSPPQVNHGSPRCEDLKIGPSGNSCYTANSD